MGRNKIQRVRVGHIEQKRFDAIFKQVKKFSLSAADAALGETKLNSRLITHLQASDPEVRSLKTVVVKFAGEKFVPDGVLVGTRAHPLLAIECKKLSQAKSAKKCWKEGLAQAALYGRRYKFVILVLYDFTGVYKKAFGRGNKVESSFARHLQEMRVHVTALSI